MKRLASIILVVIMCLSATLTLAESKDGITFRNIPWESSIDDVLAVLKKEFGKNIKYESVFERTEMGDTYGNYIHFTFNISGLKVAGFPVKGEERYSSSDINLELFFLPDLDETKSSFSTDKGKLIGAKYCYIYSDKMSFESLYAELEKKLSGLYGSAEKLYTYHDNYWKRKWTDGDVFIIGDTTEKANVYKKGIITITSYEADGCSLTYCYLPESIQSDLSTIYNIIKQEEEEQRIKEQKEKEEQQKKEEDERGTDGL